MKKLFPITLVFLAESIFGALAQTFPSRPVTFVVALPAGGAVDALMRVFADHMKSTLGQPIIIESPQLGCAARRSSFHRFSFTHSGACMCVLHQSTIAASTSALVMPCGFGSTSASASAGDDGGGNVFVANS
jgi:hypothetical protein